MTAPVKLSLAAVSPPPIELSDIGPDNLVVTIPALGTSVVADLLALEDAVDEAAVAANAPGGDPKPMLEAVERAADYVRQLMRKYNPQIPEDLDLPTEQVQFLLSGLAGGSTVASAVHDVLSGSGLADPERLTRERQERERAAEERDGESKPKRKRPLAPQKRSQARSSPSAKGTTGDQNGGGTQAAPGRRSSSTSRKRSGR